MKNDLEKITEINAEMLLNDMLYNKIQLECEMLADDIIGDDFTVEEKEAALEKYYFFKRVLSLLNNNDIPFGACAGLFCSYFITDELYLVKDDYIGDSDTDGDIFEFILEYGYRQYIDTIGEDDKGVDTFVRYLDDYYETFDENRDTEKDVLSRF